MRRFRQVVVTAAPADAVTSHALDLQVVLREAGGGGEVYARNIHPDLAGQVTPVEQMPEAAAGDALLFHASIGDPIVAGLLEQRPEPLVLMHHNMSPAEPIRRFDPDLARLLDDGRRQLVAMRPRVTAALAVSAYNAEDLRAMGYPDVTVTPFPVDVDRLRGAPVVAAPAPAGDGPLVLAVGQLLPHKRPDLVVEAFHVLQTHLLPEARLVIVGAPRLPAYARAVATLAAELHIAHARLLSSISLAELVALYREAAVYVTASEHEGFCVPLVEAMALDAPVIARATTAIPETLGGAGLLLPAAAGPLLLAEALREVVENTHLRDRLVELGRQRVAQLDPDRARRSIVERLAAVA